MTNILIAMSLALATVGCSNVDYASLGPETEQSCETDAECCAIDPEPSESPWCQS